VSTEIVLLANVSVVVGQPAMMTPTNRAAVRRARSLSSTAVERAVSSEIRRSSVGRTNHRTATATTKRAVRPATPGRPDVKV